MPRLRNEVPCVFCGEPTTSIYTNTPRNAETGNRIRVEQAICNSCVGNTYTCSVCFNYVLINDTSMRLSTGIRTRDSSTVLCFDCLLKQAQRSREFNIKYCAICNEPYFEEDIQEYDTPIEKRLICKKCAAHLKRCDKCGDLILGSGKDVTSSGKIKHICGKCSRKEKYVTRCYCCGRICLIKENIVTYNLPNGDAVLICRECAEQEEKPHIDCITQELIPLHSRASFEYEGRTYYINSNSIIDEFSRCTCDVCQSSLMTFKKYNINDYILNKENYEVVQGLIHYSQADDSGCSIISACYDCIKNNRIGVIKRYGYKPSPKFKQVKDAEEPALFIGVENEVNFPSKYVPAVEVCKLYDAKETHYYIKRDGSLDNGFEIVTHPCHFEYFKSGKFPIDKLFNENLDYVKPGTYLYDVDEEEYDEGEYDEDDNPDLFKQCGMHIHLSKVAFSNAHLYKFMRFFLTNEKFIEKIAGRKANHYCPKIMAKEMKQKALTKGGGERDQVNCQPDNTVEVRVFQGAITPEDYLRNIEFVYSLFRFTKKSSLLNITVDNYKKYVHEYADKYPYLAKFI